MFCYLLESLSSNHFVIEFLKVSSRTRRWQQQNVGERAYDLNSTAFSVVAKKAVEA
jgi:hypothetical protein